MFTRGMGQHIAWVGVLIAALCLTVQSYALRSGLDHARSAVFLLLSLSQMAYILTVRSDTDSVFRLGIRSNRPLVGAIAVTIALQFAVIYIPQLQPIFKTAPLNTTELAAIVISCSVVFVAVEFEKWLIRTRGLYS
jgi:Ca2+-transporting ATPase